MKITKTIYIFIHLLLAVSFWNFAPLSFLNRDIIFFLTMIWSISAGIIFKRPINQQLNSLKYKNNFYWLMLAIMISMISADLFWNQSLSTTFITQRFAYPFVALLSLLYIQPTDKEIINALKWISIGTIIMWCVTIFSPQSILSYGEIDEERTLREINIGFYVSGIQFVLIYLYFLIQDYIGSFSIKKFIPAILLVLFFILYQNRSMLIGVILVFIYSIFKLKSKYKILLSSIMAAILIVLIINTSNIWTLLLENTQVEVLNDDYARWKALFYYFNDYSPNWFCYIFGNGMPSGGNSAFGNLMWQNMDDGIYASDLGMIGMWTTYGLIPIIIIYLIVFNILIKSHFPLMLKFMCIHILIVPTIFHFWENPGVFFFCIIIYLYAYFQENKNAQIHAGNYNRQLQKRRANHIIYS